MNDMTKASLIRFLDMMIEKGWVNLATGGAMRTSVKKILSLVSDDTDVTTVDVAMALRQYNNLHPGELSPDSLKIYEQRVIRAIRQFQSYVEDPTSFKPSGRIANSSRTPKSDKSGKTASSTQTRKSPMPVQVEPTVAVAVTDRTHHGHHSAIPQAVATELNLALPFPLRPNYLAQVVIPRDLTTEEAERLCTFIKALAQ